MPIAPRYSAQQLRQLDWQRIPNHVALIIDGNRRWARQQGRAAIGGYRRGAAAVMEVACSAKRLGIKILTVYAFSTENWQRSSAEVGRIFSLLHACLLMQRRQMVAHGIRLQSIGDLSPLPAPLRWALKQSIAATTQCRDLELVLAINYGGRNEICRALDKIVASVQQGAAPPGPLSEALVATFLDTAARPDPDLLIRTGGEQRLSNFLLWQLSYAEIFFSDVLWPDFNSHHFLAAIVAYQQRQQRRGK